MAREAFIDRNFKPQTLEIIRQANEIIAEFRADGFTLTLRQLYYQFVSRDLIENKQTEYDRLGSIINDGRLAGLIDWSAIEDRTRNVRRQPAWDSPTAIIEAVADQYQEDLWLEQQCRVEVWIEKDALVGVVEPVCERWRLPLFACRGYSSQSEQYAAGKRFARLLEDGIEPIVLHLGDHDPSGIDMTRDNRDRLSMFAGGDVTVKRLALNMDQVRRYRPPPNPAKESDGRAAKYIEQYGPSSWELDALSPRVIDGIIDREIKALVDLDVWTLRAKAEKERKATLQAAADRWDDVADFLSGHAEEGRDDD
jgi:hypothetical protein